MLRKNHSVFLQFFILWKLNYQIIRVSTNPVREKCPYSEFFWPVFIPNTGKCGPEKLQIRTLFTQWPFFRLVFEKWNYNSKYVKAIREKLTNLFSINTDVSVKIANLEVCFEQNTKEYVVEAIIYRLPSPKKLFLL